MSEGNELLDLIKIFKAFGECKNTLPKEHEIFVKKQIQKNYDTVTKTYVLGGKTYTGTYKEDPHRKDNKDAYFKESKLATVLASFGFDVILIEENNSLPGKKPDAIVNGVVMDFKEIHAIFEKDVTKNTLGKNYQNGMRKEHSAGVAFYLHNFSNEFVTKNMGFKETRRGQNGIALFFHENSGSLQLLDMQKIRAAHKKQALVGTTPRTSSEHHSLDVCPTSETISPSSLASRRAPNVSIEHPDAFNISQKQKKSSKERKKHQVDYEYTR